MYRASPEAPILRTISPSSCCAGTGRRRSGRLPDDDLDPTIPRLGHLVGGRHEELALAASAALNLLRRDPALDEAGADAFGAQQRQAVVVVVGADGVGMADDHDLGRRATGDVAQHGVDDDFRLRRELVAVQEEVELKRRGPRRLGAERRPEGLARFFRRRCRRFDGARYADLRGRVRGAQDPHLISMRHDERAGLSVGAGKENVEIGPRGRGRRRRDHRHLRAAREECRDRNPENRADHRPGAVPTGPAVRTTNSVPRTPRTAAGVRTFIASGDCLAILPDTAASVPRLSDVSNAPLCVVGSKAKRSMARLLSGPIDSRVLSPKVIPTDPSAPVITTSPSRTLAPTGTGSRCPTRSIAAGPLETLTIPTSSASAVAGTSVHVRSVRNAATITTAGRCGMDPPVGGPWCDVRPL